jgi:effector-binding domain-containing protein
MSEFDGLEYTEVDVPAVDALQVKGACGPDPSEIGAAMGPLFGQLMGLQQQYGLTPAGPPRSIYTAHGPKGIEFLVAIPVAGPPPQSMEGAAGFVSTLDGGRAMRFTHKGPYNGLMATYGRITEYLKSKGLIQTEADWARYMPMWEEYLNDPQTTPEAELLTYIYLPVRTDH